MAKEIGNGYEMLYTGKRSERNGVGVMLNESMETMVVDVIRKINRITAVKLVLGRTGLKVGIWPFPPGTRQRHS